MQPNYARLKKSFQFNENTHTILEIKVFDSPKKVQDLFETSVCF